MTSHVVAEATRLPLAGGRRGRRLAAHPWVRFGLRRLGGLGLSLLVLTVVTFLIVPLIPGDPAAVAAGDGASPAQVDQVRAQLGLDNPLPTQFVHYASNILHLRLGTSFVSGEDVTTLIFGRLPYTAELALLAIVLMLLVAVPLGMTVALMTRGGRNSWVDAVFNFVTSFLFAIPQYVMATLMILVFAVTLKWFPAGGAANLSSLVLPTASLMMAPTCIIARVVRREATVVLDQDYIRTARGWRLNALRMHARYVLPNLLTTTLTLSGLILAAQLGGAVVVETVFSWPGLGQGIVSAIVQRDYPVIQGTILVLGTLATLIIILVDLILAFLDPRQLGSAHHDN